MPMTWLRGTVALMAVTAAGTGCSGESLGGNMPMPSGTGGSGVVTATGGISGILGTGGGGTGGTACGFTTTGVAPIPPDILVVFDRSATMADDVNGMSCTGECGASSKWSLLAEQMENVIAGNPQENWGLMLYGGPQTCGISSDVAVDVGPGTLMPIVAAIASAPPTGDSPTSAAILNAVSYLDGLADDSQHYIMLVTDGLSSCVNAADDGGTVATTISNAFSTGGWITFVVGIDSGSDATALANLTAWAQAGGPGNSLYAPADLQSGPLSNLSKETACTRQLSMPPAPGVSLAVSVTMSDGSSSTVPEDPINGWSFSNPTEMTINLNLHWCQQIQAGQITSVSVHYACPDIGLGEVLR